MDSGPEGSGDRGRGLATGGAAPGAAGEMISVTRSVPLSRLTAPSGRLSLARLRDLVSELKAGHQELGQSTLGDLEIRRRGDNVELRMYFLPAGHGADGRQRTPN